MSMAMLAGELRRSVDSAPSGQRVVQIHLFGIRRSADLQGVSLKELVALAGIPASYHAEIYKGMRLAEFVVER